MSMFGNLGELGGLMKQFSTIQKNMGKMKEELAVMEISGKDSAGQSEVVISGDFNLKRINVSTALAETKDHALIEASVGEALTNALSQAKTELKQKFSEATGGFNLPGMM